ncbi:hypothetical protein [Glycomyces rhizosphaerae]|uniref:Uncharacterized protein n=1 Tax=Glycomyces rhizosphaerae TaxID=2054422 RepID=A0ABV7Q3M3_9ACTN
MTNPPRPPRLNPVDADRQAPRAAKHPTTRHSARSETTGAAEPSRAERPPRAGA